ncbi:MAG: hypothetical protein U0166_24805 [Acidobacteriota bacterium]
MAKTMSVLEENILKAKGVTAAQIKKMAAAGIRSRADFATVGDAATLAELSGASAAVAAKVMEWALGKAGPLVVESSDVVYCVHCRSRQPKDYKSGDLCTACGKQAEPVFVCFWCSASGPGSYCRACGAELVPTGELELAVLLKRDGLPKDEIPRRLRAMTAADKDALWGRVRRR